MKESYNDQNTQKKIDEWQLILTALLVLVLPLVV